MMQGSFLLCLCQRGAFTGSQTISFFAVPLSRKRKAVSDRPIHEWNKPSCTAGKPGRMILSVRPDTLGQTTKSYFLAGGLPGFTHPANVPFFFWHYPFFTDFSFEVFLSNLPPLPFTSIFASFSDAASGSHFRSGRKGNSGIGRECKVKPPVFGKNLQPCG